MTGKQLKNAILQLAIQGKLVPQDAADEPASALLAKIRKEKEQLVKAGKLKKKDLETTPITDEEKPFEIPGSWEWVRLGEIGSWGSGATPAKGKPEYYNNGTIPWLRTGELNNGYVFDSEIKVTQKALDNCSLRMCSKGDVLIAMYGATIGKVAIAGIELTTNQACCACTPIIIFNEYLMWYLLASKQAFIELGEGGAQPNISREKIVAFPFALPPIAEQHRIVAKIEELMPLVEEYGSAQEKLNRLNEVLPEALKKSILQQAIQGKLVPQDPADEPASALLAQIRKEKEQLVKAGKLKKKDLETTPITDEEKPFEIPESWEWVRLGEIFKINMGQSPTGDAVSTAKNGIEFHQGKIKFGDKYIGVSDFTTTKPNKIAEPLDLLLCVRAPVGEVNITERKICIGRGLCGLTPTGKMPVNFWFYAMKTLIPIFNAKATGSTFVAISNDIIVNQIIPLPPLAEQHRIVAKIEELMAMVDGMK